jgi:mRNA interferase RelE/StbE
VDEPPHFIAWTPSAKRALQKLPDRVGPAVIEFVYGPLAANPQRVGKALRFGLEGLHSARRGDFRIIHRSDDDRVTILAIDHRSDIYRPR